MSSFFEDTIHPRTGKVVRAFWIDDYFGNHKYGVRFEGEDHVYAAKEVRTVHMLSAALPTPEKDKDDGR